VKPYRLPEDQSLQILRDINSKQAEAPAADRAGITATCLKTTTRSFPIGWARSDKRRIAAAIVTEKGPAPFLERGEFGGRPELTAGAQGSLKRGLLTVCSLSKLACCLRRSALMNAGTEGGREM